MAPKRGREETVDAIAATNEISPEPAPVRSSRESKKCNECRRRHVKCDEARPRCSNCVKSNAECSYSHRGMRYDHISDRQKRNDMYTEIKDISERVENLLAEYRPESAADDVTRLAIEYGWKVTVAPDGQKRILTNIETTSQLAALIPRAIEDVYGSDPSTPPNSLPEANGNNDSNRPSMDIPVRINIPDYVDRLVGTPSTTTAYMQCPCLFTFVLSPHMMNNMSPNVDFDNIKTAICSDPLLLSCIHTPEGFFQHLPPITGLKMENVLVQDSRLTRCSYANIFWNLLKTARLIDQEQYSQAYVNHGLTISKAFTLQLHKETGLAAVNGFLAREIVKRLFWAIWLFDVQLSLFLNIPSTIDLSDIEIDRPSTCEKMTQEDLDHSRFLQLLIDVRWLRVKMDVLVEESKLLNIVTQNIRELRRFHDKLDTNLRIEATVRSTEQSGWQRRTAIIILLDLASCFLAVFCKHLGRTDMVGLLALSMCRQAADIAILLLEKWISERFDCQYRLYLPLIIHSIAVHKHICQRKDVPIQYKWKAYATLQYLLRLFNAIPDFFQLRIGQALFGDVSLALKQLEHIAQTDMSLIEDPDAIKHFSRYFSDWRPSMDTLPLHEHTFIFASESRTMYTIVEMKKAGN